MLCMFIRKIFYFLSVLCCFSLSCRSTVDQVCQSIDPDHFKLNPLAAKGMSQKFKLPESCLSEIGAYLPGGIRCLNPERLQKSSTSDTVDDQSVFFTGALKFNDEEFRAILPMIYDELRKFETDTMDIPEKEVVHIPKKRRLNKLPEHPTNISALCERFFWPSSKRAIDSIFSSNRSETKEKMKSRLQANYVAIRDLCTRLITVSGIKIKSGLALYMHQLTSKKDDKHVMAFDVVHPDFWTKIAKYAEHMDIYMTVEPCLNIRPTLCKMPPTAHLYRSKIVIALNMILEIVYIIRNRCCTQ